MQPGVLWASSGTKGKDREIQVPAKKGLAPTKTTWGLKEAMHCWTALNGDRKSRHELTLSPHHAYSLGLSSPNHHKHLVL